MGFLQDAGGVGASAGKAASSEGLARGKDERWELERPQQPPGVGESGGGKLLTAADRSGAVWPLPCITHLGEPTLGLPGGQ